MKRLNIAPEQLKELRLNLSDGLMTACKPISDNYIISDLKNKLVNFDNIMWGIDLKSKDDMITHDEIQEITLFMYTNLEIALSLLEYVDEALETGESQLPEERIGHFPAARVKKRIDEYRKENAEIIKQQEKFGNR